MDSLQCDEFVTRYKALGFIGEPCSQADVAFLEQKFCVRLPAAYRAFLLLMGQNHWLPKLRAASAHLLMESGDPFALPTQAFIYMMHQGYQFLYFLCDGLSEDPPVYHYLENEPAAKEVCKRFSEWMELCAREKREFEAGCSGT